MFMQHDEAKAFDIDAFFRAQAIKDGRLGTNSGMVVYDDGRIHLAEDKGCHAQLADGLELAYATHWSYWRSHHKAIGIKPKHIYTSLWSRTYSDSDLEFFRFCLNERWSPWRDHIRGRQIIMGTSKEGKEIPVAVKFVDMEASIQVLFNLMLVLRMVYASPGLMRAYAELRKKGFTRTESLFLGANFAVTPSMKVQFPYMGDFAFDTAFADLDWKKWSTGKPKFEKKRKLSNDSEISPCNAIWNIGDEASGIVIAEEHRLRNNTIHNLITEERETINVFGVKEKGRVPLSLDEAVKKLKDNQEAWKCLQSSASTSPVVVPSVPTPSPSTDYYFDTLMSQFAPLANSSTLSYFTVGTSGSLPSSTGSYQSGS